MSIDVDSLIEEAAVDIDSAKWNPYGDHPREILRNFAARVEQDVRQQIADEIRANHIRNAREQDEQAFNSGMEHAASLARGGSDAN